MDKLYIALLELRPQPDCSVCPPEFAGAAVRCYVAAQSLQEAVERIVAACLQNGFEVVSIDWCVDKDEVEWENPDSAAGDECVERANSTGEVIFGPLYTWRRESGEEQ